MSGKICAGTLAVPTLKESKAYAEGRRAKVEGAASSANPHPDGTPEQSAWHRGWSLYESAGTDRFQDCTAYPVRLSARTGTIAADAGDATGLTWDALLSPPTPCMIDWGDDTSEESATGAATHVYPAATQDYTVRWIVGELVIATDEANVVYVPPPPPAARERKEKAAKGA